LAGAADSFGGEATACEVAADAEADLGFAIGDVEYLERIVGPANGRPYEQPSYSLPGQ
jgi:hypothetical protein